MRRGTVDRHNDDFGEWVNDPMMTKSPNEKAISRRIHKLFHPHISNEKNYREFGFMANAKISAKRSQTMSNTNQRKKQKINVIIK